MKKVSGVDGCRGGWFAFHFDGKNWSGDLFEGINELYNESDSQLILIDIPIGLRTNELSERLCDLEARKILEHRKSSIFPAPSRLAINCNEYRFASLKSKEATGRGCQNKLLISYLKSEKSIILFDQVITIQERKEFEKYIQRYVFGD